MAEFKAGTREQVKNGQAQYVAGDIVSKDAINAVGGASTRTKGSHSSNWRSSSEELKTHKRYYMLKRMEHFNQQHQKKMVSGLTSDPDYPLMAGVADAELQKDLANPKFNQLIKPQIMV